MKTLMFEDDGQDFMEWDIDGTGFVVACRPFQSFVWCGMRVVSAEVGKYPQILMKKKIDGTKRATLQHRVLQIKEAA